MKRQIRSVLLVSAILALQPTISCAQQEAPVVQAVALEDARTDLAPRLAEFEERGASGFVAVRRAGETLFMAFGAADAATGRGYMPDTQFDIGSITKPLTGLVASQLMSEGVLDPNSTLADHFENVPANKAGITVQQLLTHSAGFSGAHGFDLRPMDRDEMLAEVLASDLLFEPGSDYRYSNTGFSLVAAIIEKLTGDSFETVATRMFASIDMNSTGYWTAYDEARSDHDPERGPVSQASWGGLSPVSWALTGNGGMVSSANDLLGLGEALLSGDLPDDVAARWKKERISEGPEGFYYGYGLAIRRSPVLGDIYWHNGGNPAFRTEWWNIVESDTSVVVHLNDGDAMIDEVLTATLEAITGLDLRRSTEDAEVELGTLPDGEEGRVAAALAKAILSDDRADWESFVNDGIHPDLRDEMPMEAHLAVFGQLHAEVAGGTVAGYAADGPMVWIGFDKSDGRVMVGIEFEQSGEGPRIVGVRSE